MLVRPDNRAGPLGANPLVGKRPVPGRGNPAAPGYGGASADPLAGLLAAYPHPESDATLASRAQGMVDPLIAALTDSINRRATAGAGAIRGYTGQLQQDLGKYAGSAAGIYGNAEASQAASDNALAQRLTGGGSELAAGLADRLKGIGNGNDPAVAAAAADVAQTGQGAGNALYGKGSAALSDLIARGAGAQDYAAKLPGIAGLGGAQQIGQLEQRAQGDIAQGASDIRSKLPDLVASLRAANDQKQGNLAQAGTQLYQWQQGRQDVANQNAANRRERSTLAKMANETSAAKAQQDWQQFLIGEQDRNARANAAEQGRTDRANAAETGRTARATAADAARVAAASARQRAAAAKAGAPAKPTAHDVQTWKGTAATVASNAANGFTDATGKAHPPISEQAAYDEMRKEGIPDPIAREALKRVYGDRDPGTNPAAAGPPLPPGYGP